MKVYKCLLALGLTLSLLTSCSGKSDQKQLSAEERTQIYKTAIEDAQGQEISQVVDMITSSGDDLADLIFDMLGIKAEDMSAFALSVSPVNIRAYGVAAIFPAAGRDDDVLEGLHDFIDNQKESFHQYLMDQYEIAANTRLETLEDGTILMVMSEDQDAVFDAIRDAIEGQQKNT